MLKRRVSDLYSPLTLKAFDLSLSLSLSPLLPAQLRESKLELPSLKRLCVRDSPLFTPLPGLVKARMNLLNMQTSVGHVIPRTPCHVTTLCAVFNVYELIVYSFCYTCICHLVLQK